MLKDNLRALRESYGISQKALAKELGFSFQRYNHYETGKREPDEDTLNRIATYYCIPVSQLFAEQSSDYFPWWHRVVDRVRYLIEQKRLTEEELSVHTGIEVERIHTHLTDLYVLSLREIKAISEFIETQFPVSQDDDYKPISHQRNKEFELTIGTLLEKQQVWEKKYGAAQRQRTYIAECLESINPEGVNLISNVVNLVFSSPDFIRKPEEEIYPTASKED